MRTGAEGASVVEQFQDRFWTSKDGLELYARDYPPAPVERPRLPVVCLHGLTRNSRDFEDLAPWIAAQGRRVVVPDVRGRGRSAYDPKIRYRPDVYVGDMLAMMRALQLPQAIFIGTSMGGLITTLLAARRSRAVAAAVLNDVGPRISAGGIERIRGYVGRMPEVRNWQDAVAYCRAVGERALPHVDAAGWEAMARRSFREDASSGRPVLDYDPQIAAPLRNVKPPRTWIVAWLLFAWLARRRPVLLLRGEHSDILDAGTAARMRRVAPTMRYAEVPDVGHAPMLDEPAARSAIEAFLARCP
jgi:pimeloyl-ACP methyl ester carboxylesterase